MEAVLGNSAAVMVGLGTGRGEEVEGRHLCSRLSPLGPHWMIEDPRPQGNTCKR